MNFQIEPARLHDFIRDIRRLGLRHKPFTAHKDYYDIELYPNPNTHLLYLKYCTWQALCLAI